MEKRNSKLIDKVISSLDWDSILEVNKCFKIGIGGGSSVIPGLKRKSFDSTITKNDLKNELKTILKYAIENDIAEVFYGSWMVFWVNGEWVQVNFESESDEGDEDEGVEFNSEFDIQLNSSLEVIYSPQRISVVSNESSEQVVHEESDLTRLESMLKKALDTEKYELASKIKDLISLQNEEGIEDK